MRNIVLCSTKCYTGCSAKPSSSSSIPPALVRSSRVRVVGRFRPCCRGSGNTGCARVRCSCTLDSQRREIRCRVSRARGLVASSLNGWEGRRRRKREWHAGELPLRICPSPSRRSFLIAFGGLKSRRRGWGTSPLRHRHGLWARRGLHCQMSRLRIPEYCLAKTIPLASVKVPLLFHILNSPFQLSQLLM